jgi:hypothetical protein
VRLLPLQRGHYRQRGRLVYPPQPQHIALGVGSSLAVTFFLDLVLLGHLTTEEVKHRILGPQGVFKSRGLRSDSRLH